MLLSAWYLPAIFVALILSVALVLASSRATARDTLRQEEQADRRALEVTGDLAAGLRALSKASPTVGEVVARPQHWCAPCFRPRGDPFPSQSFRKLRAWLAAAEPRQC